MKRLILLIFLIVSWTVSLQAAEVTATATVLGVATGEIEVALDAWLVIQRQRSSDPRYADRQANYDAVLRDHLRRTLAKACLVAPDACPRTLKRRYDEQKTRGGDVDRELRDLIQ